MSKLLDDHTKKYKKAKQEFNKGTDSEFFELIPRSRVINKAETVKRSDAEKAASMLQRFYTEIAFCFLDCIPFSILSCILTLPEQITDWPSKEKFCTVLTYLLADCGFLFAETRPTLYPIQDFVAALDQKNLALEEVIGTESSLISEAQRIFWKQYASSNDKQNQAPAALRQLELIAVPEIPDFFRRCLLAVFHIQRTNRDDCGKAWNRPSNLMVYCQQRLGLSSEQLQKTVQLGETAVSLHDALGVLSDICNELLSKRKSELDMLQHHADISKEAFACYQKSAQLKEQVEAALHTPSFPFFSEKLPERLKENMAAYYQYDKDFESLNTSKQIPQRLQCSRFTEQAKYPVYGAICQKLGCLYCTYWAKRSGKCFEFSQHLQTSMAHILGISFMEAFCIHDEAAMGLAEPPVTLAPVTAYLIFRQYDFCAERVLKSVTMKTLFSSIKLPTNSEHIQIEIELYTHLCEVYAEFYGTAYNQRIQEQWNAAFFSYSGFLSLFAQNLVAAEQFNGTSLADSPIFFCCKQIFRCLSSNQVPLAHDFLSRQTGQLEHFRPQKKGDPGWAVCAFFQRELEFYHKTHQHSLVEQFQNFLLYPYSPGAIRDFLCDSWIELKKSAQKRKCGTYRLNCIETELVQIFPTVKAPEIRACAALEYTMRTILMERCRQRLCQWLSDYADIRLTDEII